MAQDTADGSVPTFSTYYPSVREMGERQHQFYSGLHDDLDAGRYRDVDGQISYLFVYVYELLSTWGTAGFEHVHRQLLELAEIYHQEEKFAWYCRLWACDCLIALERYEAHLQASEPSDPFGRATVDANDRCNVAYAAGRDLDPLDLFKISDARATRFSRERPAGFRDHLNQVIAADVDANGRWVDRILAHEGCTTYGTQLFRGAPIRTPRAPFDFFGFHGAYPLMGEVRALVRDAENQLRDAHGVPQVGQGWVSETELYQAICDAFPGVQVVQHGRPPWLGRQHLDVWLPHWNVAVEYHGRQHFEPVEFFGGQDAFERTVERDERKLRLCRRHRVKLIVATEDDPVEEVVAAVAAARPSRHERP